jgi:hypothetical protein
MKEQYMTLVTPCNVAITMAEQSNNVSALLEAIGLKLAVLSAAEAAPSESQVSINGNGWTVGKEGGVNTFPLSSAISPRHTVDDNGKITQDGFGPHFGGISLC